MSGNPNYNALQHEVCVKLGFCGWAVDSRPSHVDDLIPDSGSVSADQFVEWLFVAEGLDPLPEHRDRVREAFIRHMGSDVVDASALKWDLG